MSNQASYNDHEFYVKVAHAAAEANIDESKLSKKAMRDKNSYKGQTAIVNGQVVGPIFGGSML